MTTWRKQANSLLRKSLVYQKRSICTNICLLSAPIVFTIILFVMQRVIDSLLSGVDYECGCQCIQCCYNSNPNNCTVLDSGFCNSDDGYSCLEFNTSNCALSYSSPTNAAFCAIPNPSNWPALTSTPEPEWRVGSDFPATSLLVTAVTSSIASSLGALLVNQLIPAASSLFGLAGIFLGDEATGRPGLTGAGDKTNAYLLSEIGMQLGSSQDPILTYYIESAFTTANQTYVLLPASTCESIGLNQTQAVTLTAFFEAYGPMTIPNTTALPAVMVVCTDTVVTTEVNVTALDNTLYCGYNQARCNGTSITSQFTGAWDFKDSTTSSFSTTVYYNGTYESSNNEPVRLLRIPGLVNMAAKAWFRSYIDASSEVPPTSLLGVMSMPKPANKVSLDFSSLLGPLFYCWVVQLLFPTFLQQLVYEKEKRLRMMMKMHGLGDSAYWAVTYAWFLMLYITYIAIFIIVGSAVRLNFFVKTNYGIQIVFYLLQGFCMIAFAFMMSSFFTSALTAVTFAYLYVFASGLIGSLLLQVFINQNQLWVFFIEWIPAFSLYRGLAEIGAYAFRGVYRDDAGMQWSDLTDTGNGMLPVWGIFIVESVLFMVLGWYFEQVISTGNGVRRRPLFFLDRWLKPKAADMSSEAHASAITVKETVGDSDEMVDVAAEKRRVEEMVLAGHDENASIVCHDLQKIFPGQDGGKPKVAVFPGQDGGKPKVAVRSLTLAIERGECFGLLGPNGAGKSTAINMLTGFLEATEGTALVEGIKLGENMQSIYKMMGVCPQHDLLWEQLTAEEHLLFYGRLKGMEKEDLAAAVTEGLQGVNLLTVRNKPAGKFSGGMKRRLSVAISFIGKPKVVYLDEPSTGLDPASRRQLWNVVKKEKQGRACILTTHSMEEAEVLCDRLGIFVDGRLVCIGAPKEITSRYAGYLVFTITVAPSDEELAREFVKGISPNSTQTYALAGAGTSKHELPTSDITLSGVFDAVSAAKQRMTIIDWGVANATLEEVFIKFARASNMTMSQE
ncbi:hypothetical protein FOA52_011926 [Chlamydomonas sp. UWO 241]|nr:hypothetical protein FOA52_011926 [Chlamydomonas sp. UWO 241]